VSFPREKREKFNYGDDANEKLKAIERHRSKERKKK